VLVNFSGDASTNDIHTTHQKWLLAANALVARLHAVADWGAWYAGQQALPAPLAWEWNAPERATFVNRDVKSSVDTNRAGKAAVLDAVKTTGLEQLSTHYGQAGLGWPGSWVPAWIPGLGGGRAEPGHSLHRVHPACQLKSAEFLPDFHGLGSALMSARAPAHPWSIRTRKPSCFRVPAAASGGCARCQGRPIGWSSP
jgi:hypothetical protein